MKQISYVMVKPEFANDQRVVDEVKARLKANGIEILDEGFIRYDKSRAKRHYHEHIHREFYPKLEAYITGDKAYGMRVEGENAIAVIRELAGPTNNPEAGSIRYDIPKMLGKEMRMTENVIHSSDKPESAKLELEIFDELLNESEEEI